MRKLIALLLALVMVLALAACGQSAAPASAPAAEAPAAEAAPAAAGGMYCPFRLLRLLCCGISLFIVFIVPQAVESHRKSNTSERQYTKDLYAGP